MRQGIGDRLQGTGYREEQQMEEPVFQNEMCVPK